MKKRSFTLSETLIALTIIGIIAAITIPNVMLVNRDRQIVSALKKMHTSLSQAHRMARLGGEDLNEKMKSTTSTLLAATAMLEYFEPYLNITKKCTSSSITGCFPAGVKYKRLNGANYGVLDTTMSNQRVNARLADGTSVAFFTWGNKGCNYTSNNLKNVCGQFYVDVNGDKGPNQQGIDYFSFYITETDVVPEGADGDVAVMVKEDCLIRKSAQGWNCAPWVLYKENLDYLQCSDLDWYTKTSCKEG